MSIILYDFDEWKNSTIERHKKFEKDYGIINTADFEAANRISKFITGYIRVSPVFENNEQIVLEAKTRRFEKFEQILEEFSDKSYRFYLYEIIWKSFTPSYFDSKTFEPLDIPDIIQSHCYIRYVKIPKLDNIQ